MDADTLANCNLDELRNLPWSSAAVPCPSGYRDDVKLYRCELPPGSVLTEHDTFNRGVLYVTPDAGLFHKMLTDCTQDSAWHIASMYPESHFLKWAMRGHWRAMDPAFNLCPIMTKEQANGSSWQRLSTESVRIFHFMGVAKPLHCILEWSGKSRIDSIMSVTNVDAWQRGGSQGRALWRISCLAGVGTSLTSSMIRQRCVCSPF